ncbi:hypothetical protein QA601_17095 [Chitinispirillales bacterium ANBcel5]|uniref:hypothetical protein n=1 Tax=Cellulosispirillum alkaliphilum TaxID=3039283 RepID=UPI002A56A892|nr:hypothetical protein [Chitinispirillales bacterium ANBcel5]
MKRTVTEKNMKSIILIFIVLLLGHLKQVCPGDESYHFGSGYGTGIVSDLSLRESDLQSLSGPCVAVKFMNEYIAHNENTKEWIRFNPLVTESFKESYRELVQQGKSVCPKNGWGFDLILNAQDHPDGFVVLEYNSGSGHLLLNGVNWPAFIVTVKVKFKNERWLVNGAGVVNIPTLKRAGGVDGDQPKIQPLRELPAQTIEDAWLAIPAIDGNGCDREDLGFNYGIHGGMRSFFCRVLTVFSWQTFIDLAPVNPFHSGPHQEGQLNLNSDYQFGYYDRRFVRWAVDNLIPGSSDNKLRTLTRGIYNKNIRSLARTYWQTYRAISSDTNWLQFQTKRYIKAAENGRANREFFDTYELLGGGRKNWGGHNPNHVRTATMWWVRRTIDETEDLWAEGLRRLLETYDSAWFQDNNNEPWTRPLPPTTRMYPEYK